MATKRGRKGWGPAGPPPVKKRKTVEVVAPQASLVFLPDNVLLHVMSYLDVVSLVRVSRTCRRVHQLFSDETLWADVDLGFMAECGGDVRTLKKFIRRQLGPATKTVRVTSNAYGHRKSKSGRHPPLVTASLLEEVMERCPHLTALDIRDCDLTQFPSTCEFFHCTTVRRLDVRHCITELRWMKTAGWVALTHLSLAHTVKTSDADLNIIVEKWAVSLRSLVLAGCYRLTDAGILLVCDRLQRLTKLDVSECKSLTRACLLHISKLRHLRRLSLAGLPDVMSGVEPQAFADMFSHISCINLSGSVVGSLSLRFAQLLPAVSVIQR